MKKLGFFFLLVSLLTLVSCEQDDYPETENDNQGRFSDPLRCENGGEGCDMTWIITASRNQFPDNIEILINDVAIFDECKRKGNVYVDRTRETVVDVKLWKYIRLKNEAQEFSLQINNLGTCYTDKKVYYRQTLQKYDLTMINGETYVTIDL